ncbi:polysaccharide deacetylase family protein [Nonomuraea sp. NPDC059194]|uniref:polysaccharide deacetylase family protein n=1 Tax=Nonomuraea sp. NPDC059194 TaxID=3346764 RepID=UPI0036AD97EE
MVGWRALVPIVAGLTSAVMVAGSGAVPAAHAEPQPAVSQPAVPEPAVSKLVVSQPAGLDQKVVYLTFDDGPSEYTTRVLDILRRHDVRATFFLIGANIRQHRALARRVFEQGHSLQNHSWSHPDMRGLSWPAFKRQVLDTDAEIRKQTGYTPQCLRPPYGAVDKRVRKRAAALDKRLRLWTVDPRDWARPGAKSIARWTLKQVEPGGIVLFHDGGGDRRQTVAALPKIIKTLKARGYVFHRLWCG